MKKINNHLMIFISLLILTLLILTGCGNSQAESQNQQPELAREKITNVAIHTVSLQDIQESLSFTEVFGGRKPP